MIEPLRPVRAHLLLADGVLTIADFEGRTAQGRLVGFLQLDGRNDRALWTADMRALGIDLAHWLRLKRKAADAPPYISGKLDAMVKVKGIRPLDRRDPRQPGRRPPHARARRHHLAPRRRGGAASTSPRRSASCSGATSRCRSSAT